MVTGPGTGPTPSEPEPGEDAAGGIQGDSGTGENTTPTKAACLLDPITGDVFWLFADGTWAVDHAHGPLAPTERHWGQTYVQRRARRGERAAARAVAGEFEACQEDAPARAPPDDQPTD